MANGLQRVPDAIALKRPDKVPFHSCASPELAMREAGRKVREMYLDPEMFFEAMVASHRLNQDDFFGVRVDPFLIGEQLARSYESRDLGSLEELRSTTGAGRAGAPLRRRRRIGEVSRGGPSARHPGDDRDVGESRGLAEG
jgi:hypothetical protein